MGDPDARFEGPLACDYRLGELAGTARATWLLCSGERIVQPVAAGQAEGGRGKSPYLARSDAMWMFATSRYLKRTVAGGWPARPRDRQLE
jgi:hypothetical protein